MPKFVFTAIDSSGQERTGTVEAANMDLASTQVKSQGLFPTNLALEHEVQATRTRERRSAAAAVKSKKPLIIGSVINAKGLTVFTRQLATLTQSGLPLLRSVEILARQERNPSFKWVLEQLADNIRSGNTFSEGLQMHPKVFSRLYVNMVRAGEAGGVLDVVLNRLARFMEKAERIKGRIRAAMLYPIIIIIVTIAILTALMTWVVPQFEGIYRDMLKGAALPALTQMVLNVSRFIVASLFSSVFAFLRSVFVLGGIIVGFVLLKNTRQGRRMLDLLAFHLPVIGQLARRTAIARFSRTLGTLLSSGVPILQALQITRDTSGNSILVEAIDYVHDRVKEGEGVSGPLEQRKVFPAMVTSMIEVGEETGELYEMLNRIADAYDEEVDNAVTALTSLIEPVMIVFLAVVVGTIVIALFMPIVEIIKQMQ